MKEFIFGHSLINHASHTPMTAVPYWMNEMAQAAGKDYAFTGQYGFLPGHATREMQSQWGFDGIDNPWDSEAGESFADADFTHITITPANFVQWQGADEAYYNDPNMTPVSATSDIIENVLALEPGVAVQIYENWPDMAPFIQGEVPTEAEYAAYNDYMQNGYHDWFVEYFDALQDAHPDVDLKMINVGSMVGDMLTDPELGLDEIPLSEIYVDNAPHGSESLYFLASLVHYQGSHGEIPPADLEIPSSVHPLIVENYQAIREFLAENAADVVYPMPDTLPALNDGEDAPSDDVEPAPAPEPAPEPAPAPEVGKTFYASSGSTVTGTDGFDTLVFDQEAKLNLRISEYASGQAKDMSISGIEKFVLSDGNDFFFGAGDATVDGGAGNDTLLDGDGSQVFTGGSGWNLFSFWEDGGAVDEVTDFRPGEGLIDLSAQGIWNPGDITLSRIEGSSDVLVEIPGDSVILRGMWDVDENAPKISAEDFMLSGAPSGQTPANNVKVLLDPAPDVDVVSGTEIPDLPDQETEPENDADLVNVIFVDSANQGLIRGTDGEDAVVFLDEAQLNLRMSEYSGGLGEGNHFEGIENFIMSDADDFVWADREATFEGNGGNDRFLDGEGAQTFSGGEGHNFFSFWEDGGAQDRVTDFEAGRDQLDFTAQGIYSIDELVFTQVEDSSDLMISTGNDTVILEDNWDQDAGTSLVTADDIWFG